MTDIIKKNFNFLKAVVEFDRRHPYIFSFIISAGLVSFVLFKSNGIAVFRDEVVSAEKLTFVDIEEIQPPKRVAKQEISEDGEVKADSKPVSRAQGSSDSEVVDLAFHSNVAPPKVVGRLPKLHPNVAKEENVSATVFTEVTISAEGKVLRVTALHVKLSKDVPDDLKKLLIKEFIASAKKTLYGARFTSPIVNGKKTPIKMELPLHFKLQ